jgi:formamidopyrimidine-DNA glycosylase
MVTPTKKTRSEKTSPEDRFVAALLGKKLKSIHRKGKQLWFELDGSDVSVLFHFGMTGSFIVENAAAPTYKSFRVRNETWPPKFTKLELAFSNGLRLAFCDPRRLARIRLRVDPLNCSPIKELGIGTWLHSPFDAFLIELCPVIRSCQ